MWFFNKAIESGWVSLLSLTAAIGMTASASAEEKMDRDDLPGVLQEEPPVKIGVDVAPTEPHRGTTLASSLEPVMHTLGRTGWTPARIQGVLGHSFHFQMAEGGGVVYHDNLDWSLGLKVLP